MTKLQSADPLDRDEFIAKAMDEERYKADASAIMSEVDRRRELLTKRLTILRDRAHMLATARAFFHERGVFEVDCPLLSASASIDAHIDLIPALDNEGQLRYLHSSPEYGMKRLLVEGMGDIYQLAHVFRQGEYGVKHNPEFMMAEWYRIGIPFAQMMEETCQFIRLFLGPLPSRVISYREALQKYTGLDYVHSTAEELLHYLEERHVELYPGLLEEGKDALLNLILGLYVEPELGKEELTVLAYYPSTQAALAKTEQRGDETVAERFEVYYKGIELANGYHELANAKEQRERLYEANDARVKNGKNALPIDENFLKALKKGLPDCCGVAVGFDRLMLLKHSATQLNQVIPFDWSTA